MFPSCLGTGLKLFCHTSKAEIRHRCEVTNIQAFSEWSSTWLRLIYTECLVVSAGARAQTAVVLSTLFNSDHFVHLPLDGNVHAKNF